MFHESKSDLVIETFLYFTQNKELITSGRREDILDQAKIVAFSKDDRALEALVLLTGEDTWRTDELLVIQAAFKKYFANCSAN